MATFLTFAWDKSESLSIMPGLLHASHLWGISPTTHWIGDSMGHRNGLDILEKRQITCPHQKTKCRSSSTEWSLYQLSNLYKDHKVQVHMSTQHVARDSSMWQVIAAGCDNLPSSFSFELVFTFTATHV
jgi:hypothetical protein